MDLARRLIDLAEDTLTEPTLDLALVLAQVPGSQGPAVEKFFTESPAWAMLAGIWRQRERHYEAIERDTELRRKHFHQPADDDVASALHRADQRACQRQKDRVAALIELGTVHYPAAVEAAVAALERVLAV